MFFKLQIVVVIWQIQSMEIRHVTTPDNVIVMMDSVDSNVMMVVKVKLKRPSSERLRISNLKN